MRGSIFGSFALVLVVGGCAAPTTVHLSAPGAWTAKKVDGATVCALPCTVSLDDRDTVVVGRTGGGGSEFLVQQSQLGPGTFSAFVHTREEKGTGARVLEALSSAALAIGSKERDRSAGLVLTGVGAAGLLVSDALPKRGREELWLQKVDDR